MFFVWKEATSRLTKWPTGEMNEMKNSSKYKPWIVDVGVDFDLVLGSMLMLKICFDVVDGDCDVYNMIMVMLCLWQCFSLLHREPIFGKWGWHLGLCPLCSKKPRQALLLMTVVSRQMTSWWIIPCLVEQTAPMLVLADTVDFSSPHQGVSGDDTAQAPPRVCFTCDAQLFCLSTICFQQLLSNRRRQGGPLGPSKY